MDIGDASQSPQAVPQEEELSAKQQPKIQQRRLSRRVRLALAASAAVACLLMAGLYVLNAALGRLEPITRAESRGPSVWGPKTTQANRPRLRQRHASPEQLHLVAPVISEDATVELPAGSKGLPAGEAKAGQGRGATGAYEEFFGPAVDYRRAARVEGKAATDTDEATSFGRKSIRGMILKARLLDEVASAPAGAAVVASLDQSAQLGAYALPRGSQAHGEVVSGDNNRVYIEFRFFRLPSGETIDVRGVVRDRHGRQGVMGRRVMGAKAAESVGISALSRAAHRAGRVLAGQVGDVLGAGVEGASDSTSRKMGRLDRDESVIIVSKGMPVQIYVQRL